MSDRRITIRFFQRAVLAASLSCAVGSISPAADPAASREYPTTYSSRKAPWYDPFRWYTSAEKPAEQKPAKLESLLVPITPVPPVPVQTLVPQGPVSAVPAPAWKWYGYGTPSPNNFANVPSGWHASSGATPGAVPLEPSLPNKLVGLPSELPKPAAPTLVPQPVRPETPLVVGPPSEGPKLPGTVVSPPIAPKSDVDWKSAPSASLRLPTNKTPAVKREAPRASLRSPVPLDGKPTSAPAEYSTPLPRVSPPSEESKEIPVVPAPGILVPK